MYQVCYEQQPKQFQSREGHRQINKFVIPFFPQGKEKPNMQKENHSSKNKYKKKVSKSD